MTCRIEVFVRSGHTLDLSLEDGEDRAFTAALHSAWDSPEPPDQVTYITLGQNAAVLANEVVGYRLHGTVKRDARRL